MADAATAQQVVAHLGEVDYPADKDALLAAAERHGAPDDVLHALRTLPQGIDYAHADEVGRSLGPVRPSGDESTHAAEQARADARAAFTGHPREDDGAGAGPGS